MGGFLFRMNINSLIICISQILYLHCGMEFKTLRNAIEYSPDKAFEFVLCLYSTLDTDGKAVLRAKFKSYFLADGTTPLEDED